MKIFCVECKEKIRAFLVTGADVYPHRHDLANLKFWQCKFCKNFVGIHKNSEGNMPLGSIPNIEVKKVRIHIHKLLDPIWRTRNIKRSFLYKQLSTFLGYQYHTASIKSVAEGQRIIDFLTNNYYQSKEM